METSINFSTFTPEAWNDRKIALDSQSVQTFASQNNFTYSQELPYDGQHLPKVIRAVDTPVKRDVVAGTLNNLGFELFQRAYVHYGGNNSSYRRMLMAVVSLPYACPEIVVFSKLGTFVDLDGESLESNYPGQRLLTADPLVDQTLSFYTPNADAAAVQNFLQASKLAETMIRMASFCRLHIVGSTCLVFFYDQSYMKPSLTLPTANFLHSMTALEAITGCLSAGLEAANIHVDDPTQHKLRVSTAADWKVFGGGLLVIAALVAVIGYLVVHQASGAVWGAFVGGCVLALVITFFVVANKGLAQDKALVQKLQARYGDMNRLPD